MTIPRLAVLLAVILALAGCASPRATAKPQSLTAPPPFQPVEGGRILQAITSLVRFTPGPPDSKLNREIQEVVTGIGRIAGKRTDVPTYLVGAPDHQVESYLRLFSKSQKKAFKASLSRAGRYLPMMKQVFQKEGLPQELIYLALVESAYNPMAVSPKEATGIWQFMEATARRYGLQVDAQVDERRDPEKSTRAAARYLKDLHRQFGCWHLAAAAYNAGEGRVSTAIRRHGVRDFWGLAAKGGLPRETCNFVPQWVATVMVARQPQQYGLGRIAYQKPWRFDRVKVPSGADLHRFAEALGVELNDLVGLNPELQLPLTPLSLTAYELRVPAGKGREARRLAQGLKQGTIIMGGRIAH